MQYSAMGLPKLSAVLAPLLLAGPSVCAQVAAPAPGAEFEISKSYESSGETSDGSSSSSSGRDVILERVVSLRDGGMEVEYDLPKDATADERARIWQYPARVFKPASGPPQVLNAAEMEIRLGTWLKRAGLTKAACGRWIFTWNAFQIECDPKSVIATVQAFDLSSINAREGAEYGDAMARAPGRLRTTSSGRSAATFTALLEVDPAAVHRARAESDVVTGEIMRKPLTFDAALRERAKARVSGTISVALDSDSSGAVWRRTKVTRLKTEGGDHGSENDTATETVERRLVSPR